MIARFAQPDWDAMFAVNTPLIELAVRATVLYGCGVERIRRL